MRTNFLTRSCSWFLKKKKFGDVLPNTALGLSLESGFCGAVTQACHSWAMSPAEKCPPHTRCNEVSVTLSVYTKEQHWRHPLLSIFAATFSILALKYLHFFRGPYNRLRWGMMKILYISWHNYILRHLVAELSPEQGDDKILRTGKGTLIQRHCENNPLVSFKIQEAISQFLVQHHTHLDVCNPHSCVTTTLRRLGASWDNHTPTIWSCTCISGCSNCFKKRQKTEFHFMILMSHPHVFHIGAVVLQILK